MSEANKELVSDTHDVEPLHDTSEAAYRQPSVESRLEAKLKGAWQKIQQQADQIADIQREIAEQAQMSQAKVAYLENWYSTELDQMEQKLRGYVDAQIAGVEISSSTSLDTVSESNDAFTTGELEAIASALDAADARIVQHQAVTEQLKDETRRGLSELAKVVATL